MPRRFKLQTVNERKRSLLVTMLLIFTVLFVQMFTKLMPKTSRLCSVVYVFGTVWSKRTHVAFLNVTMSNCWVFSGCDCLCTFLMRSSEESRDVFYLL